MRKPRPDRPANFCSECGEDFSSLRAFDTHRVGPHDRLDPVDGRHCLDRSELPDRGLEVDTRGRWQLTAQAERARQRAA